MSAPANISPPGNLNTKFKIDGTISQNTSENVYTIYDLEKRVIDSLNDVNTKLAQIFRCTDIPTTEDIKWNIQYDGKKGCENTQELLNIIAANGYDDIMIIYLRNDFEILKTNIDALKNAISNLNTNPPGINNETYNQRYSSILNKYAEIVKMKNEIALKINDINYLDNKNKPNYNKRYPSPYIEDSLSQYNATMYSTLMLTVLATSLAYYAFLKL